MSWGANEWARKARVGDSKLKLLLLLLSNYANERGECWYSQDRIAFDSEIPVRTLRRKLTDLEARGFIEIVPRTREDGSRSTNLIRLLAATPPAKMAGGVDAGGRPETPMDVDSGRPPGQNAHRPKTGVTTGQKAGSPSATKVAGAEEAHEAQEQQRDKGALARDASKFFDERFWPTYPKRLGGNPKEDARKKFVAAVVSGENPELILAGVGRLVQEMTAINKLGTEIVPMAVTWLNKKRWKDDAPDPELARAARTKGRTRSFFDVAQDHFNGDVD